MHSPAALTLTGRAPGFEARGFIWGAPLALALQCSFVPLRKPGKLPGKPHPPHLHHLCPTLSCQALSLLYKEKISEYLAQRCMSVHRMFGAPCACAGPQARLSPLSVPGTAGETVRAAYKLEYGEDVIEMHTGAVQAGQRVLLVDDLIATGGTMGAGIKLMHQVGDPVHL